MPKDEFDFEDPLELNGMAFLTHEDTTGEMADCFIEEFLRMGYGHKQVLALFRNPHYLGPNLAYEKLGEPYVRDRIAEIFSLRGKKVAWTTAGDLGQEEFAAPATEPPETATASMAPPASNLNR